MVIRNATVLSVFLLTLVGCKQPKPAVATRRPDLPTLPIHLVVPDAFRGQLKVIAVGSAGKCVEPRNGRYVLRFEMDGVLRVEELLPFSAITAEFRNGTMIPTLEAANNNVKPETMVVKGLGVYFGKDFEKPTMIFLVGTAKDVAEKLDKLERGT
jgi:hypothetical protein